MRTNAHGAGASVDLSGDCGVWCTINGPRVVGSLAGGTEGPGILYQKVEIRFDKCDIIRFVMFFLIILQDQGMCQQ